MQLRFLFKPVTGMGLLAICLFLMAGHSAAQPPQPTDERVQIYLPLISSGIADMNRDLPTNIDIVPNQYIVVLRNDLVSASSVAAIASEITTAYQGQLLHVYDAVLNGFAVQLPAAISASAVDLLKQDPRIAYIEPDRVITLPEMVEDALATEMTAEENEITSATIQINPPWGLDRIDQRILPIDNQYNYRNEGQSVRVYIIDTAIYLEHREFENRAQNGTDLVGGKLSNKCYQHGTHVAGIIGGKTYGVAKKVTLIAVRTFDCNGKGKVSKVLDGLDWVAIQRRANPTIPTVVNLSAGINGRDQDLGNAVSNLVAAGATVVVAAGNDNKDACDVSPAFVPEALTVGATNESDKRATFRAGGRSNFGNCIDLFAPGDNIRSASPGGPSVSVVWYGTSFAAPHVTGVAALYLQNNPSASPTEVTTEIINNATIDKVQDAGNGSPNRLLYTPPPTQPPTPGISQKLAIPAYIYPVGGSGPAYWTQLENGAPTVGIAVVNPHNGVGSSSNAAYITQINHTKARNITVIGYVDTKYGKRPVAQVKAEIDKYALWYGVTHIYLDKTNAGCTKVSYYRDLYNYVKQKFATAKVVLGFGSTFEDCMMLNRDIIAVNFSNTYAEYLNWQPQGWEGTYPPEQFWHLIHTTSEQNLANAIALSKQRHAGWVYVTPDQGQNPWDTLPPTNYWNQELTLAQNATSQ